MSKFRRAILSLTFALLFTPQFNIKAQDLERLLLYRLSVFVNNFSTEAAESVCTDSILNKGTVKTLLIKLVDKSLIIAEKEDKETRYYLTKTQWKKANDGLKTSGETVIIYKRFADYYLTLARYAQSELFGPKRTEWLERLEQEHANLRKALDWLLSHAMVKEGLQMTIALREFWLGGNHVKEGREYLSQFLTLPQALNRTNIRASALDLGGIMAYWQSDQNNAVALVEESLAIRRELGNKQAIAFSLLHLGLYKRIFEEDYSTARDLYNESLIILEELDNNTGIAYVNMNIGCLAIDQGDCNTAYPLLKACLMTFKDTENVWAKIYLLDCFSTLAACKGQPECALRIAGASEALRESINSIAPPVWQSWVEGFIKPMKHKLGEKKSNDLWSAGRAMNLPEVLNYIFENLYCFK